jgi:hypothetical protein
MKKITLHHMLFPLCFHVIIFFFVSLTAVEAPALSQVDPDQKAIHALKDHLAHGLNRLGLPKSFIPVNGYDHVLLYPDRCYVFDMGALLAYAAQDPGQWEKYINPVVDAALKLQNSDGMWARAYDDRGIAEDGLYAGPSAVLARGLLNWGNAQGRQTAVGKKTLSAALKTADWLRKDLNKIKASKYYVIKQVTGPWPGSASPEENARTALFFMDLYAYFMGAGQKEKALQPLNAAENILAGICCLRAELYPFGISENGAAIWEMPDREGVEGQCVMLQALYAYFTITRKQDRTPYLAMVLENDFARKKEILAWTEKTHCHQHLRFTDIDGKNVLIPLSFSKRLSPDGNAAPHMWLEFMARMALTYRYGFNQEQACRQLLSGMISLQQSSGFFPYAVGFNGYKTAPAWPLGSEQQNLNVPFGSLIATVEFLFACQNAENPLYAAPFAKFP